MKKSGPSVPPTREAPMAGQPAFNPSSEQSSAIETARDYPQGLRSRSAPLPGFLRGHFLFLTPIICRI
jgi:hypothetical protein